MLAGAPPAAALTGWTGPEVIIPGRVTSVVEADAHGKLHLITYGTAESDPYFGKIVYATNASGAWTSQPVLANTDTVGYIVKDLVVNAAGEAFILYVRGENPDQPYGTFATYVRTNRTGAWVSKKVLWHGGSAASQSIDLAVAGDRIHVAWMCDGAAGNKPTLSSQHVCVRSEKPDGLWSRISVTQDPAGVLSRFPQLAVDAQGRDHLIYDYLKPYTGYDLRYATNSSGAWVSGIKVWDHVRWDTGCIHDEPRAYDIAIGPNGVPQVGVSVSNGSPDDCGGPKGLFYAKLVAGQWSIAKVRADGRFVNLEVDSLNRAHWLINMCIPVCVFHSDAVARQDYYHAVRTASGLSWTRVTAGWANDLDSLDLSGLPSMDMNTKLLVVMPWNKPCFFLPGGYTSDPDTTGDPWIQYRTCQT
jgi:hypothetical protein